VYRQYQFGHHQFGRHPGDKKAARRAARYQRALQRRRAHTNTKSKEKK
jgi:hypothetical protein